MSTREINTKNVLPISIHPDYFKEFDFDQMEMFGRLLDNLNKEEKDQWVDFLIESPWD